MDNSDEEESEEESDVENETKKAAKKSADNTRHAHFLTYKVGPTTRFFRFLQGYSISP
jgi:hypothetical protein